MADARPDVLAGPLTGLRVVDAAEHISGPYAARLLGDLGADVIKLETEQGDSLRTYGFFPEDGLTEAPLFHLINAGKSGWVIDPQDARAQREVVELLAAADVVITSEGGALTECVEAAAEEAGTSNRGLVVGHISATPAHWEAATRSLGSLHVAALGGVSSVIGDPDREPIPPPFDILDYQAGAHLAAAILAACRARSALGKGQRVHIIASEVAAQGVMTPRINEFLSRESGYTRTGRRSPGAMGGIFPWGLYPCADGYIIVVVHNKDRWQTLLAILGNPNWSDDSRFEDPLVIAKLYADEVDHHLSETLRQFTRAELFQKARDRAFTMGPVWTIRDVLESDHLRERGSLSQIELGDISLPFLNRPYFLSRTPTRINVPAGPRLTTHDRSACSWRCPDEMADPMRESEAVNRNGAGSSLRVVDFSWNWAGPMVGAALADLGAEVIRVEHRDRLDNARLRARPIVNGKAVEGPLEEVSYYFHQNNRGKAGVTLNLKHPGGVALARALIEHADLVIENYTPGVFERAGLGYSALSSQNPRLVWLSMTSAGHSGPLSGIRTYAPIMSGLAGLEATVGYEGEEPSGMLGYSFGDVSGGAHALVVALATLEYARRTGMGQFIDFSLIEMQMSILYEPMSEIVLGRERLSATQGLFHHTYCPYGHYRCKGEDKWIALSVHSDAEWLELADIIGFDARRARALIPNKARLNNRKEVDDAISHWSASLDRDRAVSVLLERGLSATPVNSPDDLVRNWPFGNLFRVEHPIVGSELVMGVPWHMEGTPPYPRSSAPLIGQDTERVLKDLLGLEADAIKEALQSAATR